MIGGKYDKICKRILSEQSIMFAMTVLLCGEREVVVDVSKLNTFVEEKAGLSSRESCLDK